MRHRIDLLLRRLYGPRGKRIDPHQLLLYAEMAAGQDTVPRRPSRRRRPSPSGGADRTAADACRTTCPASPGTTSCPRPSASVRPAVRRASISDRTGANNSIIGRRRSSWSSTSSTNMSAPAAASSGRKPQGSQHAWARSLIPCPRRSQTPSQHGHRRP
jgi:hypothetical protein